MPGAYVWATGWTWSNSGRLGFCGIHACSYRTECDGGKILALHGFVQESIEESVREFVEDATWSMVWKLSVEAIYINIKTQKTPCFLTDGGWGGSIHNLCEFYSKKLTGSETSTTSLRLHEKWIDMAHVHLAQMDLISWCLVHMFEPQAEREATAGALDSAESMPAATEPSVKEARFWLFMALSKNPPKNLSENSLKMRHGPWFES